MTSLFFNNISCLFKLCYQKWYHLSLGLTCCFKCHNLLWEIIFLNFSNFFWKINSRFLNIIVLLSLEYQVLSHFDLNFQIQLIDFFLRQLSQHVFRVIFLISYLKFIIKLMFFNYFIKDLILITQKIVSISL